MAKYLGSKFLADVLADTLTGLSTATSTVITAADSILGALGKLQAQLTTEVSRATTAEGLLAPKANPSFTGTVVSNSGSFYALGANTGAELGSTSTPNTPFVDFHSSGNNIDYDARIIASGGTATVGQGGLTVSASSLAIPAPPSNANNTFAATTAFVNSMFGREALFVPDPTTIDATGTNDSTSGIQVAITACQTAGGGIVQLPYGVFKISSTLTVTKSGVRVRGAGHGAFHDVSPYVQAGTLLLWNGAVGGTMMALGPVVSASSQKLTGCAVQDIAFQGTADLTTAKAAYGLVVTSTQHSEFDIYTAEFSTSALAFTVVSSAIAEAANCEGNIIRLRFRQINLSGTALQLGGTAQGNTCFNTVELIYGYMKNGFGLDFQDCDNNVVQRAWIDRVVGGTGFNAYFRSDAGQGGGVGACARVNTIQHFSGSVHTNQVYFEGTEKSGASTASFNNSIERWDAANHALSIVWGTGAISNFYQGNTSPIGIREASSTHITYTNGYIDFWGVQNNLGAGTTSSIIIGPDYGVASILHVTGSFTFGIGALDLSNWSGRSDGAVNKFDITFIATSGATSTANVAYRGMAIST